MSKPNLFLDLDNTLLSAVPIEEIKWTEDNRKLACEFPFHNMEDYYLVFERPGLDEFLDFIFSNFNVSVWSAASKDYVLFIVDKIIRKKPGRNLDYIMFSNHCDECKKHKRGSIKLLDFLWDKYNLGKFTKENTFIIDDNDIVIKHNPFNSIHIKEFEFEDGKKCKDDRELVQIIPYMQKIKDDYSNQNRLNPDLLFEASSVKDGPLKKRYRFNSPSSSGTEQKIPDTPLSQDDTSKAPSPLRTPSYGSHKEDTEEDMENTLQPQILFPSDSKDDTSNIEDLHHEKTQ